MTTPPIEPPEPEPTDPNGAVPPQVPSGAEGAEASYLPPRRYETRTLWVTAIITVLVLSGLTAIIQPFGLLAPLTLIMALFFIRKDATAHRRSIVTGVILGSGIGLLTTAGICTGIFNGSVGA